MSQSSVSISYPVLSSCPCCEHQQDRSPDIRVLEQYQIFSTEIINYSAGSLDWSSQTSEMPSVKSGAIKVIFKDNKNKPNG